VRVFDHRCARTAPIAAVVRPADGLAVGSFREMLDYLRYFTSDARLRAVRASDPATLADAWSRFVRNTDPDPSTPANEAMIEYFRRLEQANERFGEGESAGWSTARGRVFDAFGPPDATEEPTAERADRAGARLVWTYHEPALRVVFVDRTGRGDWQLDAASALEFTTALARLTWCGRCG
jgi:GWxTD domain-containing protein